jgi:hypothetical protein
MNKTPTTVQNLYENIETMAALCNAYHHPESNAPSSTGACPKSDGLKM